MAKERIELTIRQLEGTAIMPMSQVNHHEYEMRRMRRRLDQLEHNETVIYWSFGNKCTISSTDEDINKLVNDFKKESADIRNKLDDIRYDIRKRTETPWYRFIKRAKQWKQIRQQVLV